MTTGRINQVTTFQAKDANRPRTVGFVTEMRRIAAGNGPRAMPEERPDLTRTSFGSNKRRPQSEICGAHRCVGPSTEGTIPDRGRNVVVTGTDSQIFRQTFGQRPSIHRSSNSSRRLTTPSVPLRGRPAVDKKHSGLYHGRNRH